MERRIKGNERTIKESSEMKMTELEGIGRVTSCMGTVLNNKNKNKTGNWH
jgi:hypothetical protein